MNITEKAVEKLPVGGARVQFYDDELTGFGVRVDPSGRKSFFWRAKVNGTIQFRALGEHPFTSVKEARTAAKKWIGVAAAWKQSGYSGENPFEKKRSADPAIAPTFGELVEAYVVQHVRNTANKPQRAEYNVRWVVRKHLSNWTERRIDDITIADVLAVKKACADATYQANRCVEFVRAIFNWSAKAQDGKVNFWRVANPANDVSFHDEQSRDRFLLPEELQQFNKALQDETDRDLADFLTLAMTTAARKSDILSARWADIRWETETWMVPFPKNGKAYNVQLLPAALAVLKRRRVEIPETETFIFPSRSASGHVEDVKKKWDIFRKRAGIPDARIHDLRRTCASYLAMAGVSLQQIASALGHQNLQSVQIYAKLHDTSIRTAREAGQRKMLQMMAAAKKRTNLAAKKQKLLAARAGRA